MRKLVPPTHQEELRKILRQKRSAVLHQMQPVSYTHLDVYKRQVHACDKTLCLVQADVRGTEELSPDVGLRHDVGIIHGYEPVSYTHLHVILEFC